MRDDAIIQQVLAQLEAELGPDLLGVLAGGSRLRGEGDRFSDLDVVVVIDQPRRRRRNIVVDGVEVEMFLNPPFKIRQYFEEDRLSGRGLMPHLCATGQIVYDSQGTLAALQAEARMIWDAGPPPLTDAQCWYARYSYADILRDIADTIDHDADRAAYLIGLWLPELINTHYRVQGRWRCKPKRVLHDLETWDLPGANLARQACRGSSSDRLTALSQLIDHVLAPLGGLMPLAWATDWEELEA